MSKELRALAMAVTKGPFRHNKDSEQVGDVSSEDGYPFAVIQSKTPRDHKQRDANAAYVAALLNAAPSLLDRLDRQEQVMREALEALKLEMTQGPLIKECHDAIAAIEKELGE